MRFEITALNLYCRGKNVRKNGEYTPISLPVSEPQTKIPKVFSRLRVGLTGAPRIRTFALRGQGRGRGRGAVGKGAG